MPEGPPGLPPASLQCLLAPSILKPQSLLGPLQYLACGERSTGPSCVSVQLQNPHPWAGSALLLVYVGARGQRLVAELAVHSFLSNPVHRVH
ncbi:hypothetical protein SKAU_G00269360 [Synaphobranchus kaupii]|uniref:Uncharacterized protein n=1 Tax=Synaphobranchus kaupii TaxID=118154 RepID=A0A9Q1IQ66_SYNKA|nr:hypothetical protein SKAU_G00269360 [Synaphobranchus kaupii]